MSGDRLLVDRQGPAALLTLNRPEKRNVLSVLTGRLIDAPEALSLGVISRISDGHAALQEIATVDSIALLLAREEQAIVWTPPPAGSTLGPNGAHWPSALPPA